MYLFEKLGWAVGNGQSAIVYASYLPHVPGLFAAPFPVGDQGEALQGRPAVAHFCAPCPEDSGEAALIREDVTKSEA